MNAERTPGRPPTIADVATAAGVSRATVSRVMNGLATVDRSIADRVMASVRALGYRPSGTARSLSLGVTSTVAFIVPDLGNPLFQSILRGFNAAASADGYRTLVADSGENPGGEPAVVRDARDRCDAVVLCAPRMSADDLGGLVSEVWPAAVINRPVDGDRVPTARIDYRAGIVELAEHLVSLGHRSIAYLEGPEGSESNRSRVEGLAEVESAHPEIAVTRIPCGSGLDDGYQSWAAVERSGATAVLAFNDLVALGLLGRLAEAGVRVPDRISVAGFDDVPYARFATPALTTMAADPAEAGAQAWRQLRAVMRGERSRLATVYRPQLIVRQSTGVPPAP